MRTKSGCPAPDVTIRQRSLKRAYDECDSWRSSVLEELARTPPALVVAAGTRTDSLVDRSTGQAIDPARAGAEWRAGWDRTLTALGKADVPVAVLRDTPWPGKDMAVVRGPARVGAERVRPLTQGARRPGVRRRDSRGLPTAHGIDLTDVICAPGRCPATQGKYLVYRDESHLTATFARALAPYLDARLRPLLP